MLRATRAEGYEGDTCSKNNKGPSERSQQRPVHLEQSTASYMITIRLPTAVVISQAACKMAFMDWGACEYANSRPVMENRISPAVITTYLVQNRSAKKKGEHRRKDAPAQQL